MIVWHRTKGTSPCALAQHCTPQGIKLLRMIYDKANLRVLGSARLAIKLFSILQYSSVVKRQATTGENTALGIPLPSFL